MLDDAGKVHRHAPRRRLLRRGRPLLLSEPRTATVRAKTTCDLFVLDKADFSRILRDHPQFAHAIKKVARERYNKTVGTEQLMAVAE